ncbi:MAG: anti-sigma factor [Hyphomicrobiales bacterium]|nr:anti-sigma factor [Hyphomicrobiales bacterium]
MTENEHRILRLNAALDGELDAMSALEFERAMRDDPSLAAEYRRLVALREAIRRSVPREPAPQALIDRVAQLSAGPDKPATTAAGAAILPFLPAAPRRARMLALAASLAACGFVAGAGFMALRSPVMSQDGAAGLVADFARAEIADAPYDVASSDRHTVKPWLASRTTVSPNIVELAQAGFPLAGGRVAVVDRIPAPTLVYRHNEHLVAVTELPPDAPAAKPSQGAETIDGYHVARWSDANLAYVAVSDMDEKTLADFVAAFRMQEPASERSAP